MRLRHPPGRAGRLWLEHRLEVARRGADLLDRKRRALLLEERRLAVLEHEAATAWQEAAAEAETWLLRAAVMAGEERLELLATGIAPADVRITRRSSMGVTFPAEVEFTPGGETGRLASGSAAADLAVVAYRRAVRLAVEAAAARSALATVRRELTLAARRQRSLERKWLPTLELASRRLQMALDEREREQSVVTAWVRDHRAAGRG